jgi:hypothetical protein
MILRLDRTASDLRSSVSSVSSEKSSVKRFGEFGRCGGLGTSPPTELELGTHPLKEKMIMGFGPAGDFDPYEAIDTILDKWPETTDRMPDYESPLQKALRENGSERG